MIYKIIATTAIAICLTVGTSHADWIQSLTRGANKKATDQAIEQALSNQKNIQSNTNTQTFGLYKCTDDCSGHFAGYRWAQKNKIKDVNECDSNSRSFNEGCSLSANKTFVKEIVNNTSPQIEQLKIRMSNIVSHVNKTQSENGALGVISNVKNCYNKDIKSKECIYMDIAGKYNEDNANKALGFPHNDYYRDNIFHIRIADRLTSQGFNYNQAHIYMLLLSWAAEISYQQ